jgi:hypothetical protein
MNTRLWFGVAMLLALSAAGGLAAAGRGGDGGGARSCQTLLGKWRQAGDNHHMRKVLNKQAKIERKMAKLDCPAPAR